MSICDGYCDIDSDFKVKSKIKLLKRIPHCCECGKEIILGEYYEKITSTYKPDKTKDIDYRCSFCASFCANYECIPIGELKSHLYEHAERDEIMALPEKTREGLCERFFGIRDMIYAYEGEVE